MAEVDGRPYAFFDFQLKFLSLLQLWPKNGATEPNPWGRLKSYYFIIALLPSAIPAYYELITIMADSDAFISDVLEVMLACACILGEYYMGVCFTMKRKAIERLCESIYDFQEFTTLESMIETDKKATLFAKVMVFYGGAGALLYVCLPLVTYAECTKNRNRRMLEHGYPCGLAANIRFPFKYDYAPLQQIVFLHVSFLVFIVTFVIVTLTMLLGAMLMQATNHLSTLHDYIVKFSREDDMLTEKNFNFCVRYHIAIIKFCDGLNEAFGSQLMVHVTLTSVIISVLTFELTLVELENFVRFVLHLLGWICLLLVVCYYGQTLIDESENIALTAYNSNWHNSSLVVKKDLIQMIVRAQKPIKLNALNMGVMSFSTFLKVLSSAYSYLTLLINIK